MKYTYFYKTSDGLRHEASMEAKCREAVFSTLRTQGIKAIKVVAADGTKANGEVRGVRKRMVAVIAIAVASVAGIVAFGLGRGRAPNSQPSLFCDRHQVYGDPAIIQEIETGTLKVANTDIEKFLINYVIPGRTITAATCSSCVTDRDFVLTPLSSADRPEVTAYKQILNGLKVEAKAYLEGGGTWRDFIRELNERQRREVEIYERTKQELEFATDPVLRDERNAALRAMGLRTIPRPKK